MIKFFDAFNTLQEKKMSLSKIDKIVLQMTGFVSIKNKQALQGRYTLSSREKKGLYLILGGFLPLLPMIALSAIFNVHDNPDIHELINQISWPFGILALIGFAMHNTSIFAKKDYQGQKLQTLQSDKSNNEITLNHKNELSLTLHDLQKTQNQLNYNKEQEKEL